MCEFGIISDNGAVDDDDGIVVLCDIFVSNLSILLYHLSKYRIIVIITKEY